jgi:hypothetical protein
MRGSPDHGGMVDVEGSVEDFFGPVALGRQV